MNPKAWKDRTENDLREIFPLGSSQWLQVSQIHFDTIVNSEKAKVLAEGKDTIDTHEQLLYFFRSCQKEEKWQINKGLAICRLKEKQ